MGEIIMKLFSCCQNDNNQESLGSCNQENWKVSHLDINNSFFDSSLDEEIFMKFSSGFLSHTFDYFCLLKNFIHDLKYVSQQWQSILVGALNFKG